MGPAYADMPVARALLTAWQAIGVQTLPDQWPTTPR
jgi:hypothetical protein